MVAFAQLSACIDTEIVSDRGYLVATAEITENIDSFIGQSILVRNDVLEAIDETGFILDKDRALDGETILVINTSATSLMLLGDRTPEVLVNGQVKRLSLSNIKQEYSLNLDPSLYARYEGKPVIIATTLIYSPDPGDPVARPEIYYDKPLAIKGEVEDVKQHGVFELDEEQVFGGEDLLVVQVNSKIQLYNEQSVIVYGILRPFIADEFERDYDLGWDPAIWTRMETEYNQKPVLVTEKIQLIN
ncbi:hypothetical protein IQ255_29025 [Pleurocapsales cyanobacterium LEGE 10410]|nr:hypothetical protein [Pleurocapsales cyanobacterium LEGE 10410]